MKRDGFDQCILPWEWPLQYADAGFNVKTSVKPSTIKEAGLGRFLEEDVSEGAVLRKLAIVNVDSPNITCYNSIIFINSKEDIDNLINNYYQYGLLDLSAIRNKFVDFVACDNNSKMYLMSASFYVNHLSGCHHISRQREKEYIYYRSTCDIKAGQELFVDYNTHIGKYPSYYLEWCNQHCIRSFIVQLKNDAN